MISKKNFFLSLSIVLIMFILSCPDQIIKGTLWVGTATPDNPSGNRKGDIEFYFSANKTMTGYVEMLGSPDQGHYVYLKGTYNLEETYSFSARLEGNADFNNDGTSDKIYLDLDGILNFYTGIGNGEYDVRIEFSSSPSFMDSGAWDLERMD